MYRCETWFIDSATRVDAPSHTGTFAQAIHPGQALRTGKGVG